ncbi:MAG: GNAT family N-acetyltransferase [Solirubrobacterales bacterium]
MSEPTARAELIEDRGEAAVADDFFRSRHFLDAEGVTHTLLIRTGTSELAAPVIVRKIGEGPDRDAISPYGYPGLAPVLGRHLDPLQRPDPVRASDIDPTGAGSISDAPLEPVEIDFSDVALVTAFLRHTLGDPPLAGASERNVVQIADPALPAKSRGSDRNQINKNLRRGYEIRLVPGPDTTAAERADFLVAYEQTMRRTGAAERYFFGAEYFDRILSSAQTWLALALGPDGEIAAGSIAARSDGYLHYYLSGSADSTLRDSPMKNVVASLVELSTEQGLPLNLGGGMVRGDRLEEFKRGFANRELPWHTSEVVCDEAAYARLSAGRAGSAFFPVYRAQGRGPT